MSGENVKILLVDDEEEILEFLGNSLRRSGYEVFTTSIASEVMIITNEVKPNLIILDIIMPEVNGGEIAVALEKDENTCDIPIIFLTGIMDRGEEFLRIRAGKSYEMMTKPVDSDDLIVSIDRILSGAVGPEQL